jgi:1-acyl-sn-glycerol-3-phosphate acyltransferase
VLILPRPHTSLLDGLAVAWWLTHDRGIKNALFAADPDYARHSLYGPLLRAYGWLVGHHELIPLDSGRPMAMRSIRGALKADRTVVVFPQGTGLKDADRPDMPGVKWLERKSGDRVVNLFLDHGSRWPSVSPKRQATGAVSRQIQG